VSTGMKRPIPEQGIGSAEWARKWAERYDASDDEVLLKTLPGKGSFSPSDIEAVMGWKLRRLWPGRAIEKLRSADPAWVSEVTSRAFRNEDDLAAVLLVALLPGAGIRTASAILALQNPDRYTVMDERAWATMTQALGRLTDLETRSWADVWLPYLDQCRFLAQGWGLSLRETDRALFESQGRT
jgi:hypothetical protein